MNEAAVPRSNHGAAGLDTVPTTTRRGDAPWRPWVRPIAAIGGSLLLVVAGILPVWGTTLLAPQYPKGLALWFFGDRAEGPVREVNGLNHYIGMQPIDLSLVPEMALWPLAVVGSALVFLAAIVLRGWPGRLAAIVMVLGPVIILADIQRWLMIFGSELDPTSALRLDPFVPLVVGPSTVWNFTIWTYPGPSLVVMWVVAVLALVVRRVAPAPRPPDRTTLVAAAAGLAIAVIGTVAVVIPADGAEAARDPARSVPAGTADIVRLLEEAPDGGTVEVPAGRYLVHLDLQRPVTLVAKGEVVIDGGGRGTPITVWSDDVTVRGFTVVNTGGQVEEAAGIKTIQASRVSIQGNRLEDFFTGIFILGGEAIRIEDNVLVGSGQVIHGADHVSAPATDVESGEPPAGEPAAGEPAAGDPADPHAGHGVGAGPEGQGDAISVWTARSLLIRGNRIESVRDAIYLAYADDVLIDGNVVTSSRYGLHSMFGSELTVFGNESRGNLSGLVLMYSSDVAAGRNVIVDARSPGTGFGVVLKDVDGVKVAENLIARNRIGLQIEGTVNRLDREAIVISNRIASNDVGVALMPSADLVFGGNIFEDNLVQVSALGTGVERKNFWEYRGVGNTWSDYAGYDLENDGIGDLPHRASGVEDLVVAADPALAAFRTSPAMAILGTARSVWEGARTPVVIDASPRREQLGAQAVPAMLAADPPAVPWQIVGAGFLAATVLALVGPTRRRASAAAGRSSVPTYVEAPR